MLNPGRLRGDVCQINLRFLVHEGVIYFEEMSYKGDVFVTVKQFLLAWNRHHPWILQDLGDITREGAHGLQFPEETNIVSRESSQPA